MPKKAGKYNIKAASRVLGIQPGTLRAWERRYNFLAPERNESGHRLYSEEQIEYLRGLIKKVGQGFTISQAVALADSIPHEKFPENPIDNYKDRILDAFHQFDEKGANQQIDLCFSVFTTEKVLFSILIPVAFRLGELREEGTITGGPLLFGLSIIRTRLEKAMAMQIGKPMLSKAIVSCAPGEQHEIGLLFFVFFLKMKGFEVFYFNPGMIEEDINEAVKEINPRFLFLSCSRDNLLKNLIAFAGHLNDVYPKLRIGIGGRAVNSDEEEKPVLNPFLMGPTIADWEDWIKEHLE